MADSRLRPVTKEAPAITVKLRKTRAALHSPRTYLLLHLESFIVVQITPEDGNNSVF